MPAIIGSLRAELSASVAQFQKDMGAAADTVKGLSKEFTKVGNDFKKVGADMQKVGTGLTKVLTLPLAAIGVAVTKVAIDFDEAFDTIRAGTGATGQALTGLADSFKRVFATVPNGLQEVANAISEVHQRTGLVGPPLEELATQLLNIARITKSSVSEATASATRLFGDWSITTENQAKSLDLLFRASQQTGIGFQRLSELVVQFGAPMRALGFSFDQTAALMGKFEKEGVNLETVMAGLRFALGKFAAAGKEPAQAFAEVTEKIKNAKSETEATAIAFDTFGKRAAVDMSRAILEGRFSIDQLVESLRTGQDTINQSAQDTLSFTERVTQLGHQLAVALEPLGGKIVNILETQFLPVMKAAIDVVGKVVDIFLKLPDPVQKAVLGTAAFAAALGPVLFVGGQIVSSLSAIILAFGKTGIATRAIIGILSGGGGLTAALGSVRAAFGLAGIAATGFSATLVGLGIGAAILAIAEATRRLCADLDAISKRGAAGGPLKDLKDGFGNAVMTIDEAKKKLEEIPGAIGQTVPVIGSFVRVADSAAGTLQRTGTAAGQAAGPTKQFQEAVKALVEQFTGTALLTKAREYEAALKAIGGTSTLSVREIDAFAETFQAVIEKYRLIGPPGAAVVAHFQDLLDSLRPIPQAVKDVEFGVKGLSVDLTTLGTHVVPAAILPLTSFKTGLKAVKDIAAGYPVVFSGAKDSIEQVRSEMAASVPFVQRLSTVLKGLAGDLNSVFVAAFEGGGGIAGAIQAFATKAVAGLLGLIPGVGAFLSQFAGAVVAGIKKIGDALTTSPGEYAMKEVGRKWGVAISESLGDEIAKTAKDIRKETADALAAAGDLEGAFRTRRKPAKVFDAEAEVAELHKIVDAAGGLNDVNISGFTTKLRDTFVFLGKGTLSLSRATKVLDENFQAFAQHFLDNGHLISKELVDIIKLDEQFGTNSKAIADFVGSQAQRIVSGLSTFVSKVAVTSQQTADSVSAAIGGAFAAMQRSGASFVDTIKALSPLIEDWADKLEKAGLDGSDVFNGLLLDVQILKDEFSGPLIEGVNGLGEALAGLSNTGYLTQEIFTGFGDQIVDAFAKLQEHGVDGIEALRLMQPALQTLWELSKKFGYSVDANTQELLDMAEANGIVGEQAKPVQQQMLDATNDIRDAVEALAHVLGAVLPKDAERAKQAMQEAARKAKEDFDKIPRTIDIDINVRTASTSGFETAVATTLASGPPPSFQHGSDGLRDFGSGTLAMLHGREAVITEAQLAGMTSGHGDVTITIAPQLSFSGEADWLTKDRIRNEIAPEVMRAIRLNEHDLQTILAGL